MRKVTSCTEKDAKSDKLYRKRCEKWQAALKETKSVFKFSEKKTFKIGISKKWGETYAIYSIQYMETESSSYMYLKKDSHLIIDMEPKLFFYLKRHSHLYVDVS